MPTIDTVKTLPRKISKDAKNIGALIETVRQYNASHTDQMPTTWDACTEEQLKLLSATGSYMQRKAAEIMLLEKARTQNHRADDSIATG